jgi:hypothetical protein
MLLEPAMLQGGGLHLAFGYQVDDVKKKKRILGHSRVETRKFISKDG